MPWMNKPATTTLLLAINSLLLLVLVIQNGTKSGSYAHPQMSAEVPFHGGDMSGGNPHAMPMGQEGNFDPALMIMAAMNCPSNTNLTLNEDSCGGSKANEQRDFVRKVQSKGGTVRSVFDAIVKKYGEKALTQEAIEIRRSRRAAQANP